MNNKEVEQNRGTIMKKDIEKMTQESEDKQMNEIIIDDVNVTECEHLTEVENTYCCDAQYAKHAKYSVCAYCSNCYYKKLKRLQEKFDALANKLLNSEIDKYHLQEEKMGMKKSFVNIIGDIREENYKYYKALKEVKAISDNYDLTVNARREQIANKIDEVLKDERA